MNGPSQTDWSYDPAGGIAYANRPQQEDGWAERMRLPTPSADALRAAGGRSGVDPANPSMCDAAAQDDRVQHSVAGHIADEGAGARQESRVFGATDRLSDQRLDRDVHG